MSLEDLMEQVERYYIEMENELLQNIAKKIAAGKPMEIDKYDTENHKKIVGSGGVNEWQLERLKELGGLTEENAKIIAEYSGKTKEEIEKIFERAREIGTSVDDDILSLGIKAGILNEINPTTEDYIFRNLLDASIKDTLSTFNSQNKSLLASAGDRYRKIINDVSTSVLAGTKTPQKAMQEAVSKLAQEGLTGFTAKNGAQWTPEAYTKMVIRSNSRNAINRIQEERMRLAGNDYVQISSHIGARPLCSEDQGKVFCLSDDTTPITDGTGKTVKVYPWSNSSYGEPAGILGINCGHSRFAFVPGLSIQRPVEFTKKENDEAYIEKQEQRTYERTIRNKKREIAMLEQAGAEKEYINKRVDQLKNYTDEYLEFLDKTGRTRMVANEWVGPTKRKTDNNTQIINKSNKRLLNKYSMYEELDTIEKLEDLKYTNSDEWKKYQKYNRVITGARNGTIKTIETREKHANIFYESVRKRTGDAERISSNTNFTKEEIEKVRKYLFVDQHKLIGGTKRFDPDYDIAVSWQRLNDGKNIQKADIILIKHELLEMKYMEQGYSQADAHILSSKKYSYEKELIKNDNSAKYNSKK